MAVVVISGSDVEDHHCGGTKVMKGLSRSEFSVLLYVSYGGFTEAL